MPDKEKVFIFDTTMRDGEQSPGASMSVEEKIQISRVFDEMGIDIIEAGFPISSPGDFEAVSAISKSIKNSIPCGLARATKKDIDACYESLKFAKRFRIHTFISTSPVHMKHKLNMTDEQVLAAIKESVTYARKFTDDVEWSCEDGTRTNLDFMYKTIELAINCGAKTINIPDTVGYSIPEEFAKTITSIKNNVPNIDKAIISAHCHNDLGLAVANALSGLSAGVRQIECTINGIGERAGNAALEEVVMATSVAVSIKAAPVMVTAPVVPLAPVSSLSAAVVMSSLSVTVEPVRETSLIPVLIASTLRVPLPASRVISNASFPSPAETALIAAFTAIFPAPVPPTSVLMNRFAPAAKSILISVAPPSAKVISLLSLPKVESAPLML